MENPNIFSEINKSTVKDEFAFKLEIESKILNV